LKTTDMHKIKLIGPFTQLLTMDGLMVKGPLSDGQLEVIRDAGILVEGDIVLAVGAFRELRSLTPELEQVEGEYTVLPGLVDGHTHICWAGSRAADYGMRLSGYSYLDIATRGGGIWSTVTHTRQATADTLAALTSRRANLQLGRGITTIEVKSGYGLDVAHELKMLTAIREGAGSTRADLIPTCLAAHIKPKDFSGSNQDYLEYLVRELLPGVRSQGLASRVDIYIDEGAFTPGEARYYLSEAAKLGFNLAVHAEQFSRGGVQVAVELGAWSADHLEAATHEEISILAASGVCPVALPGASLGLGAGFAPARKILDAGASLAIASDWNPGSAPMGNLLMQASIIGVYEKLTMAETLAAVTFRAAQALHLNDRGILRPGMLADFIAFPCRDYQEILYNQGGIMPEKVWKRGKAVIT